MFSVIIPTFNSAETIGSTLQSILEQSWSDFEVIVVDNFSSDSTRAVVENFHDCRVKFVQNDNQGRPSVSRNLGIRLAKNEYVAFCDSDDIWENGKLETCAALCASGHLFVCHKVSLLGPWHKRILAQLFKRKVAKNLHEFFDYGNNIAQSSVVISRDLLESVEGYSVDDSLVAVEDAHLWCKLYVRGHAATYLNKPLGRYLYSATALSNRANQFRANRRLRLSFLGQKKPGWYKYNIATYLVRCKRFARAKLYFASILWSRDASLELRTKAWLYLVGMCGR